MASVRVGQLVRRFSTTSICNKLVQPPIQVYGLDGRYATALYSAASKQKKIEAVEKDLNSFRDLLQKDVKLADFLLDPTQSKKSRKVAIDEVVKKMSYSNLTANLVETLSENGRLTRINGVVKAFGQIMSAHRGEVVCTVTTAQPLDSGNMKELKAALEGFLKKGQVLKLDVEVDPSLVGGMVVNIGDKYVDMSLKNKIKTYSDIIRSTVG